MHADTGNSRVQLFDGPTGEHLRSFGGLGSAPGEFRSPYGVAWVPGGGGGGGGGDGGGGVDDDGGGGGGGVLLVSEHNGRRIQALSMRGSPLQASETARA